MVKYDCSKKSITIVRQFHDGMHARVQDNGENSVAFPSQMVLRKNVSWPSLFSVSCFLRCCLMHLMARIMESTFDTAVSASEGFKQRPSWRLISSTSLLSPTVVHWTLQPKPTCKTVLTSFQWPVTILSKPSKQKWCTSQRPENHISSAKLPSRETTEGERKVHLPRQHPLSVYCHGKRDELQTHKSECSLCSIEQECVESVRYIGGNQN